MKLEKELKNSVAKNASRGLLALTLAAIPLVCDNGCQTLSASDKVYSPDSQNYLQTAEQYSLL